MFGGPREEDSHWAGVETEELWNFERINVMVSTRILSRAFLIKSENWAISYTGAYQF